MEICKDQKDHACLDTDQYSMPLTFIKGQYKNQPHEVNVCFQFCLDLIINSFWNFILVVKKNKPLIYYLNRESSHFFFSPKVLRINLI